MVERAAVNRDVAGSSPASGANFTSRWWTATASVGRVRKMPKCVVKRVVNGMPSNKYGTIPRPSRYCPPTAREARTSETPTMKGVNENEILALQTEGYIL